mgnify:CR=1 FL=1
MKNRLSDPKCETEVKGIKLNISGYARDNNVSWSTAKKILTGNNSRKKRVSKKESKLAPYYDIIEYKLLNFNCSATSIFYFIKEKGYDGSLSLVIKHVKKTKKDLLKKAKIRVESTPGLQGQVDWKESLTLVSSNGEAFTINIFLYILSYSKFKYIELTIDRKQDTLFTCLVNAFRFCDGIPEEIWFDNMRTVVDRHDINTNTVVFNSSFSDFAKNCQFRPIACRPFRPCTKGIVENLAKIMNRLQVYNEEFESYEELDAIVRKLNATINDEVSQATGRICREKFEEEEKEYLSRINLDQFSYKTNRQVRKVTEESMVNYDKHKYSVSARYIGKLVEIEVINDKLHIYYSGKEISCHELSDARYNYHKEDLKEIIRGTFPDRSDDQIERMASMRLQSFDLIGKRGERSEQK